MLEQTNHTIITIIIQQYFANNFKPLPPSQKN